MTGPRWLAGRHRQAPAIEIRHQRDAEVPGRHDQALTDLSLID